jgi:hypothetical protein
VPITTCLHQCCLQLATYKWLHHWNASIWNTFRDIRQRRELWNRVFQPGNPLVHVLQSQTWHCYYTKQKGISCPVTNHVVTVEGEQPTLDHMLVIISWRDKCLHTPATQYLVNVHSSQATCQYILDLIMRPLLCTFTVKLKFSRGPSGSLHTQFDSNWIEIARWPDTKVNEVSQATNKRRFCSKLHNQEKMSRTKTV